MATRYFRKDDLSIVLCGAAGQGIQTVEELLTHLIVRSGYNLFSTKEYMSRIRGGSNSTEIRINSGKVRAYVERIDILFPFNKEALYHSAKRITSETVIFGDKSLLNVRDNEFEITDIPFSNLAKEIGGEIYINIIAVGLIAALFDIDQDSVGEFIGGKFGHKGEEIKQNNIKAMKTGYDIGKGFISSDKIKIVIEKDPTVQEEIILSGAEAVGLGALAGGCNFCSSYPMTPSTGVLTFLAKHSKEFNVVVEQAEDEIAAINMVIGAWYAGARGLVTTAGGGFALMVEGLSLAGMLESPLVIHLGQRPGPATGLPTRTEQADLLFALFTAHGEFPRVIFAPGTIWDAFYLTKKAFDLADKFQIPVFILTDQYFIDSYYNHPIYDTSNIEVENHIVKTDESYQRYELTEDGISPRGIPGYGDGLVVVDSDEHDSEGHITENLEIRKNMVEKRLKKNGALIKNALEPELVGNREYRTLVVCWGSNYNVVKEAIEQLGRDDVSMLHFKQVYPLHPITADLIDEADNVILVENNATAQFGRILKLFANSVINDMILKYNGLPFSVEELTEALAEKIP